MPPNYPLGWVCSLIKTKGIQLGRGKFNSGMCPGLEIWGVINERKKKTQKTPPILSKSPNQGTYAQVHSGMSEIGSSGCCSESYDSK